MKDTESVCYRVIDVIHSPFTDQKNTPIQSVFSSAEGRVEVFPTYDQGLEGLEGFSHIFLIYHIHQAEPGSLRETPFLDGERPRGIFSYVITTSQILSAYPSWNWRRSNRMSCSSRESMSSTAHPLSTSNPTWHVLTIVVAPEADGWIRSTSGISKAGMRHQEDYRMGRRIIEKGVRYPHIYAHMSKNRSICSYV